MSKQTDKNVDKCKISTELKWTLNGKKGDKQWLKVQVKHCIMCVLLCLH